MCRGGKTLSWSGTKKKKKKKKSCKEQRCPERPGRSPEARMRHGTRETTTQNALNKNRVKGPDVTDTVEDAAGNWFKNGWGTFSGYKRKAHWGGTTRPLMNRRKSGGYVNKVNVPKFIRGMN